jgi:hypothetical protein
MAPNEFSVMTLVRSRSTIRSKATTLRPIPVEKLERDRLLLTPAADASQYSQKTTHNVRITRSTTRTPLRLYPPFRLLERERYR